MAVNNNFRINPPDLRLARVKPRSLNIGYFNANGLNTQMGLVRDFVTNRQLDLFLVQETFLRNCNRDPKIANYRTIRNDRDGAKGGTVIFYRKTLHVIPLDPPPTLTNIEVSVCKVHMTGHPPTIIASAYLSPSKSLLRSDLQTLLDMGDSVIIAGDLNCKSTRWNCNSTNRGGIELENIYDLTTSRFEIIAPLTPTRFGPRGRPSILDIAILQGVSLRLRSIEVIPELDSDHRPVIVKLGPDCPPVLPKTTITDWSKFAERLGNPDTEPTDDIPDRFDSVEVVEAEINQLTDRLGSTLDECSREIPSNPEGHFKIPRDLRKLMRRKNIANRAHDSFPSPANRAKLWRLQRQVRARFEDLRDESWDHRLSELTPSHVAFWQLTKSFKNDTVVELPPLIRPDGTLASDDLEKAECLADNLESQCSPSEQPCDPIHVAAVDTQVETWAPLPPAGEPIRPTSVEEVQDIIKRLKPKKAPGSDRISNKILKILPIHILTLLVAIFNTLLKECSFPDQWKEAIVIGIHKPKKPRTSPSSYRPISLLSSMGKIYERILLTRLQAAVVANDIIPPEQFGFRAKHSSIHQVHRLTEFLLSRAKLMPSAAIFLDIAKAFDKVWHNGLIYKLQKTNVPDRLVHIIRDYLSNRSFRYRVEGTLSSSRPVRAGVPQGSILSPLLYNLYTHDIPKTPGTNLALFADDTAVYTSGRVSVCIANRLQKSMDRIGQWLFQWRIEVNPDKSNIIYFPLRRTDYLPHVRLLGKIIPEAKQAKYLGVILDSQLSFKAHITYVRRKAAYVLSCLYPLICAKSKLSLRNKIRLYKACVRPIFAYACVVFAQTDLSRLQVIQNRFLRNTTGAPWYMRNTDLHRDVKLDSVKEHCRKLSSSYFTKAESHPNPLVVNSCNYAKRRPWDRRRPRDILTDDADPITKANDPKFVGRATHNRTHTRYAHRPRRWRRGPSFTVAQSRLGARGARTH